LKWSNFLAYIKSIGYEGEDDDFPAVITWLKAEGHDTEKVTTDDGQTFELKQLYEDRPGKMLDVSKAQQDAEFDARVTERVKQEIAEIESAVGSLRKTGKPVQTKEHDITVGKDRLVEHPTGGFKHLGEFYTDVMHAGSEGGAVSERLGLWQKATLSTYGTEGIGVDGGFAAPPDMRDTITSRVMGEDSILSRCDQIPLDTGSVTFPDDETTPWQTSGGVLAYWAGEAGTFSQSKPNLRQKTLTPRKVYCLVPVTEELLADASAMGSYITRKAGEKLDFKIGEAIFRGTGAGQPLGFLSSPSIISVAKEANQVKETVTGTNVVKMYQRMYAPYRSTAVWFVNQDVELMLAGLGLAGRLGAGTTTTSWGAFMYTPPGSNITGGYAALMGRPVIPTQHCATVGSVGDIVFASMPQYAAAVKSGGVEGTTSIHLWFDQDTVAFKFRARVDGQPWLSSTISPRDGSNTMSAFISLAVRA
jgi:HK97 family phage major capsid protein